MSTGPINPLAAPPQVPGYHILERCGEGGMGEIFKALDLRRNRTVALKVMRADLMNNPVAVQRFYREAQVATRLAHPNLVAVYEVGQAAGRHFMAQEFVDGIDLASWVQQRGPLPVPLACSYLVQACHGLQRAHEANLVHRDLKPANLLISSTGQLKIMDLGLARIDQLASSDGATINMVNAGFTLGSPAFMAPEQATDASKVDIRADLYSLGCTLYFLLAGELPFPGRNIGEVLLKHQSAEPTPLRQLRRDVPVALQGVIGKMMAKQPAQRFATPVEVADALEPFTEVRQPTPAWLWLLLLIAVLIAGIGLGIVWYLSGGVPHLIRMQVQP